MQNLFSSRIHSVDYSLNEIAHTTGNVHKKIQEPDCSQNDNGCADEATETKCDPAKEINFINFPTVRVKIVKKFFNDADLSAFGVVVGKFLGEF